MKELARVGRGAFESIAASERDPAAHRRVAGPHRTGRVTDVTLEWDRSAAARRDPRSRAGSSTPASRWSSPRDSIPPSPCRAASLGPRAGWPDHHGGGVPACRGGNRASARAGHARRSRSGSRRSSTAPTPRWFAPTSSNLAKRFSLLTRVHQLRRRGGRGARVGGMLLQARRRDAELPQGGTLDPLLLAIGVLLSASGAFYLRRAVS
jgi:hypothetical protein